MTYSCEEVETRTYSATAKTVPHMPFLCGHPNCIGDSRAHYAAAGPFGRRSAPDDCCMRIGAYHRSGGIECTHLETPRNRLSTHELASRISRAGVNCAS